MGRKINIMTKTLVYKSFESKSSMYEPRGRGYRVARYALQASKIALETRDQLRVPRYNDGERENNAEHSYMLALMAPELADALGLELNKSQLAEFGVVHELIEIITGDVPTFLITEDEQRQKEQCEREVEALLHLKLPPYMRSVHKEYESQATPEARFVRYVDKLLPIIVDILGDGMRVMQQDYGVSSIEALRQAHEHLHARIVTMFGNEFPALDLAHKILCELFESQFEQEITLNQ